MKKKKKKINKADSLWQLKYEDDINIKILLFII